MRTQISLADDPKLTFGTNPKVVNSFKDQYVLIVQYFRVCDIVRVLVFYLK